MYKIKTSIIMVLLGIYSAFIVSCGDDDNPAAPGEENPQEQITTVTLSLSSASDNLTVQWQDLDGAGGNAPVIETLSLKTGIVYTGTIELRDDINEEDITGEIEEEADEHQFFYTVSGDVTGQISITITDTDSNDLPVGLEFTVEVTAEAGLTGMLNIILGHFDDVVKDGTTLSPETDVDVDIDIIITN